LSLAEIARGEIRAEGVGRRFALRPLGTRSVKDVLVHPRRHPRHEMWALRDVSFFVRPGETFGVIGRNGSGKSTLLKLMAYIFAPTEGNLEVGGRVGSLLEVGAGFHPDFSGVENVYLSAAVHGLGRSYVDEHLDDILDFAEIGQYAHMPVKAYSTGMFLRLGFSVAIHIHPDVLLVDEVLAVGDEAFQTKCYAWIEGFQAAGGTLVFVSHDPGVVERLCERAILLDQGRVVEQGTAHDVLHAYQRRLASERPVTVAGLPAEEPGEAIRKAAGH
jgi:ABC-type polysaccharide/polyol phosphate transport system ATPase subunit